MTNSAVIVCCDPWAGLGETVAGDRIRAGDGLVVANPQPPALGASLYTASLALA